jgi:hypothetical protein
LWGTGPAGIKQLNEAIMQRVSVQMGDIKKLVIANRQSLEIIKTKSDRVVATTDAMKRIISAFYCSIFLRRILKKTTHATH